MNFLDQKFLEEDVVKELPETLQKELEVRNEELQRRANVFLADRQQSVKIFTDLIEEHKEKFWSLLKKYPSTKDWDEFAKAVVIVRAKIDALDEIQNSILRIVDNATREKESAGVTAE